MKKLVFVFLFFPVLISAQHFKLGFDTEFSYIRVNNAKGGNSHGIGYETFIPITFNLITGYNFNKKFSLQAHIGETVVATEFSGFEVGLNGIYNLNNSFYASAGVLHHSNEGGSVSISHGVTFASLFMLTTGVGYRISKHFALEINYYYPTNKKLLYYYNPIFLTEGADTRSFFDYMFRLNFVFSWDF